MLQWFGIGKKISGDPKKTLDILDLSAFILGSVAVYLSVHFAVEWFVYAGQGLAVAILTANTFVGFMNLLFEISLGSFLVGWNDIQKISLVQKERRKAFAMNKGGKMSMGILGILLSFTMLAYSISVIVAAQYNDLISSYSGTPSVSITSTEDIDSIIKGLEMERISMISEQSILLNKSKDNEGKLPLIDKNRLSELTILISNKGKEIESKIAQKTDSSSSLTDERSFNQGNVFVYLEKVTGVPALNIQFISSALPSLFFDLISFICFGFLLYRKRV